MDRQTTFYLLIVIIMLSYIFIVGNQEYNEIEDHKVYTFGIVTNKRYAKKQIVDYKFNVDGKEYFGNSIYYTVVANPQIGDTLFVKYSKRDPSYNTMIMDRNDAQVKKKYKVLNYYNGEWPEEDRKKWK